MLRTTFQALGQVFNPAWDKEPILFKADGTVEKFPPPAKPDEGYTLAELRKAVDGAYIEIVTIERDRTRMIVDDEGLIKGLPTNEAASLIYQSVGGQTPIAGNALVLSWEAVQ